MKRLFAVLFWPLLAVWSVWLLSSTTYAQERVEQGVWVGDPAPVIEQDIGSQVYLTADPVDEQGLGLATHTGRFAAKGSDFDGATTSGLYGCDWLAPEMNAVVVDYAVGVVWLAPLGVDVLTTPHCRVHILGYMDSTPCFMNAEGACDVALELEGY